MRFAILVAVLAACSAEIVPGAPLSTLDDAAQAATLIDLDDADTTRFTIAVPAGVDAMTVHLDDGAVDTFFTVSADGIEHCTSDTRCSVRDLPDTLVIDVHGTLAGTLSWTTSVSLGDAPVPTTPDAPSSSPAPSVPTPPAVDDLVCDYTAADMPSITDVCVTEYVSCGDTIEGTVAGGSNVFDHTYWAGHQTLGGLTNDSAAVDGTERVFVVADVPAGQWVSVELDSCEPVWGSYLMTGEISGVCSTTSYGAKGHFEANHDHTAQDVVVLNSMTSARDVHLIVDSHPGSTASFRMQITCGS